MATTLYCNLLLHLKAFRNGTGVANFRKNMLTMVSNFPYYIEEGNSLFHFPDILHSNAKKPSYFLRKRSDLVINAKKGAGEENLALDSPFCVAPPPFLHRDADFII